MQKYTSLDDVFNNLKEPRKSEVEALRKIILSTEPKLKEILKWNAPSYTYDSSDRITFNLFNPDFTRLVFHAGTGIKEDKKSPPVIEDKTGLMKWNSNIRATVTFNSVNQINESKEDLIWIIKTWLKKCQILWQNM
jgi:hypothetical protein